MQLKQLSQHISKKSKIIIMALFMAFSVVSFTQISEPTIVYANEDDLNNNLDPDQDGEIDKLPNQKPEEGTPEFEYNKKGWMENIIVGFYNVNVTMFGVPINFADIASSLEVFIDFDEETKGLTIDSTVENGGGTLNLYKLFKETVYPLIKASGISILTMMMMWKFIKECLEVERFSWERAMMLIARTFIVNMFINNSFEILELFYGWAIDLFNAVISDNAAQSNITNIGQIFAAGITATDKYIEKAMIMVVGMLMAFVYYGTCITVICQVLVRYIKILVGMAFAPIPMAISVDEQHGTDVLRYIFWMIGVFLQAPILKICFYIYNSLLGELGTQIATMSDFNAGTMIPACLMISIITGLLAMLINMAQQVTDRIMPA